MFRNIWIRSNLNTQNPAGMLTLFRRAMLQPMRQNLQIAFLVIRLPAGNAQPMAPDILITVNLIPNHHGPALLHMALSPAYRQNIIILGILYPRPENPLAIFTGLTLYGNLPSGKPPHMKQQTPYQISAP
ncbi:MAG: hypothetical protein LUE13_00010 [Akkermansiaceae bacterium]|nr:hypothetical protein [Akkermansiaceae bacterium]